MAMKTTAAKKSATKTGRKSDGKPAKKALKEGTFYRPTFSGAMEDWATVEPYGVGSKSDWAVLTLNLKKGKRESSIQIRLDQAELSMLEEKLVFAGAKLEG